MSVIVWLSIEIEPLDPVKEWLTNSLLINIELGLNAINGYHSTMVISHDVVTTRTKRGVNTMPAQIYTNTQSEGKSERRF